MVLRHHLNLSEPQRTPNPRGDDDGLVNSSTRLDVVVPQVPCVRDVLPIVSGRCRPQSELAVLLRPPNVLDAPRRARVSPVRSNRAASRPSLTPNGICPRRHTHLALDGLPSFQRRGSPDSWCGTACRAPRRPKVSARADSARGCAATISRRRVTCVPAGPRRSGLQQCQPKWCVQLRLRATAARLELSAHRCGPAACVGRVLA